MRTDASFCSRNFGLTFAGYLHRHTKRRRIPRAQRGERSRCCLFTPGQQSHGSVLSHCNYVCMYQKETNGWAPSRASAADGFWEEEEDAVNDTRRMVVRCSHSCTQREIRQPLIIAGNDTILAATISTAWLPRPLPSVVWLNY